jgi:hypothetical protein
MPFLRAGFNYRHRSTGVYGWTRPAGGGKFAPAELIRFVPAQDYAWLHNADRPRFLAWGEQVVLGSHWSFDLPWCWQHSLSYSDTTTRREHKPWRPAPETLEEALEADG